EIVRRRTLRLTEQLLGRGERGRSGRAPDILTGHVRDTKIGDPPPIVSVDQDVLGLQISVKDSVRVSDIESVHYLLNLRGDLDELSRTRPLNETGDAPPPR